MIAHMSRAIHTHLQAFGYTKNKMTDKKCTKNNQITTHRTVEVKLEQVNVRPDSNKVCETVHVMS